jgi:hypothetical protein
MFSAHHIGVTESSGTIASTETAALIGFLIESLQNCAVKRQVWQSKSFVTD